MAPHPHLGYQNPVVGCDFPDPGLFYDDVSRRWIAYATNGNGKNIQAWWSEDFCCWHEHKEDVLPGPFPPWTGKPGFFWAPEVIRAPNGRPGYLLYTSANDSSTDKQCIGVAYSHQGPLGPFHFVSQGPIVSRGDTGGCIDPQPFEDPQDGGRRYLIYKNDTDKMYTKKCQLWIQPLSEDGLTFAADRSPLLAPTESWQSGLLEAPYLVYEPSSRTYVLFYSSGTFTTSGYATGYATAKHVTGPYKPHKEPLLYTDSLRGVRGPGGQSVVRGVENHWFIAFHSLVHEGGPRHMCIHRLEFDHEGNPRTPGRPHVGKRLRLGGEAEDDAYPGQGLAPDGAHGGARPDGKAKAKEAVAKGLDKFAKFVRDH